MSGRIGGLKGRGLAFQLALRKEKGVSNYIYDKALGQGGVCRQTLTTFLCMSVVGRLRGSRGNSIGRKTMDPQALVA